MSPGGATGLTPPNYCSGGGKQGRELYKGSAAPITLQAGCGPGRSAEKTRLTTGGYW